MVRDRLSRAIRIPWALRLATFIAAFQLFLVQQAVADDSEKDSGSDKKSKDGYEPRVAPVVGGNSDFGAILGAVTQLVRTRPDCDDFCWKLQVQVLAGFLVRDGFSVPFQNHFLRWKAQGFFDGKLDLSISLDFKSQGNLGYFGLGNAPTIDANPPDRFYQYKRIYPGASARLRYHLNRKASVFGDVSYVYNTMEIYPDSKLSLDEDEETEGLHGLRTHSNGSLKAGVRWESTRDEVDPDRGIEADASVRWSPDRAVGDSGGYQGANIAASVFLPVGTKNLTFASRVIFDALTGEPPVYELARFSGFTDGHGIGGGSAVRGIPVGRYHGKVKLFGNAELRFIFLKHKIKKQRAEWGAKVFVDAGRIWTSLRHRDSSKRFLGVHYGIGGGLTVRWGEHFLGGLDVAWAKEANPVGAYFRVGHAF